MLPPPVHPRAGDAARMRRVGGIVIFPCDGDVVIGYLGIHKIPLKLRPGRPGLDDGAGR